MRILFVLIALQLTIVSLAAADVEQGKKLFGERCSSCHGAMGLGDGPVAAALPPESRPANLVSSTRKFATDKAKFTELLHKGGASVGLNALMPPQPDLTDEQLSSLYEFLESLKK